MVRRTRFTAGPNGVVNGTRNLPYHRKLYDDNICITNKFIYAMTTINNEEMLS